MSGGDTAAAVMVALVLLAAVLSLVGWAVRARQWWVVRDDWDPVLRAARNDRLTGAVARAVVVVPVVLALPFDDGGPRMSTAIGVVGIVAAAMLIVRGARTTFAAQRPADLPSADDRDVDGPDPGAGAVGEPGSAGRQRIWSVTGAMATTIGVAALAVGPLWSNGMTAATRYLTPTSGWAGLDAAPPQAFVSEVELTFEGLGVVGLGLGDWVMLVAVCSSSARWRSPGSCSRSGGRRSRDCPRRTTADCGPRGSTDWCGWSG